MTCRLAAVVVTAAAVLIAKPAFAQDKSSEAAPQSAEFVVDKTLAKTGKNVWAAKGCMGCHTIGKGQMAAPDLNGLYERRTVEWIKTWLKDPTPMFETDETAKAMLKEWNGLKMPNMKLSDADIDAVMHYIASEQKANKKR